MSDLKLKLLAFVPELDEQTKRYCRGPITPASPNGAREGKFPYFHAGYVNLGIPRDTAYTDDIRRAMTGFAVADEQGRLVEGAKFDDLATAEKALKGAKITFSVNVDVPQPEAVEV